MSNDIKLSEAIEAIKAGKEAEQALSRALQGVGVTERVSQDATTKWPLRVGNKVLIRAVPHYYVGRVAAISSEHVLLEEASWVACTGRFAAALTSGNLDEVEPFPSVAQVSRALIADVSDWNHELPRVAV